MSGTGGGGGFTDQDTVQDNVHTIVIASIYGALLLVILIHLTVRWQLRRRKLNSNSQHVPGDKSFKCKRMREIINRDINRVRTLTSDVRLIDPSLPPSSFGGSKESDGQYPGHWYRMKAFDAGADFVTSHYQLLDNVDCSPSPNKLALPKFLSLLEEQGFIRAEHKTTVVSASELYTRSRYSLEDFTLSDFQQFQGQLDTLHQILSSRSLVSQTPLTSSSRSTPHTPTTPQATPTTLWRDRLSAKNSTEPLIEERRTRQASSGAPAAAAVPRISVTASASSSSRKDSKGQRPVNLELTPLVTSLAGGDVPSYSPSLLSSRTDSRVFMPGTPV